MKRYKIFRKKGRRLYSLIGGKAEVEYSLEKWNQPPKWLAKRGYFLIVFDTLSSAIKFLNQHFRTVFTLIKVWEVETRGELSFLPPLLSQPDLQEGKIKRGIANSFPEGSLMAKEVKLLREIPLESELDYT